MRYDPACPGCYRGKQTETGVRAFLVALVAFVMSIITAAATPR